MKIYFIILSLFLVISSSLGQGENIWSPIAREYHFLKTLQEKYNYIDSIDAVREFPVNAELASFLHEIIDQKLLVGDTADILGLSVSLMNYNYTSLVNPDSTINLYNRLNNYIEHHRTGASGGVILCLADAYYAQGKLELAYATNKEGIKIYQELGDSSHNHGFAYLNAADIAKNLENYEQAVRDFEAAKHIFLSLADTTFFLWSSYGQSLILADLRLYEEADEIHNEIIPIAENSGSADVMFAIYGDIVNRAQREKDTDKALYYARKMIHLCPVFQRPEYCFGAYKSMVLATMSKGEIDSSALYFEQLKSSYDNLRGNQIYDLDFNLTEARLAFANKDYTRVHAILSQRIPPVEDLESVNNVVEVMTLQYSLDTAEQNYQSAFKTLHKINSLKDSINQNLLKNQFSYYQSLFNTNKRKQKIAEQEAHIARIELKTRQERFLLLAIIGGIFFAAIIYYFIRERNQARKSRDAQEEYSHKLILAQENERKRISRELHDGVGQSLVLLNNGLKHKGDKHSHKLIAGILDEVRALSHGLHPIVLEELGLTSAIKRLIEEAEINGDIFFDTDIDNIDGILLKEHELNLYRIAQEALSNMLKHSKAEAAKLYLKKNDKEIRLTIIDHGIGFAVKKKEGKSSGIGMKTIEERVHISNGKLNIKSGAGIGTSIDVSIPYD